MKININDIPLEVRPYLYEIAERLWSGHAAVMIGAGFSRNAIKSDLTKKDIPNWNQLGDIFYEKLYRKSPPEGFHYLNVLKLADEVQAAFGRPTLDHLLRTSISDKDFEPSKLHTELLELPWSDIFTTNYDTLLERTCESVVSQKFDIVINQEDLMYAQRPRIVKLHGSFPSERPLIVTEEDYRKYPKLFAPFVNTVQQSLLENTLCLIGFSGDDPNFLQWIGWIHDNLGKDNSPKIYLIGLLNLLDAQKRLLESKNIIVVDLSQCYNINGDHEKAFSLLFSFLQQEGRKNNQLDWPGSSKYHSAHQLNIEELLKEWSTKRINFPNWVIVPEEQRSILWMHTEYFAKDEAIFDRLKLHQDLQYIYELNWRLEKCLFPIYNTIAVLFQKVINRYNPFKNELIDLLGEDLKDTFISIKEAKNAWIEISLALLRFYREESFDEDWKKIDSYLNLIIVHLNPEQLSKLKYEECLKAIFDLNFDLVTKILESWPTNESLPFWEAKKASLLAEIGLIDEAEKILERSLITIRKRQNLSPVISDYTWVSQEAYAMLLYRIVSLSIRNKNLSFETLPHSDIHKERWNILTQYKCDPWGEKKYYDLFLQHSYAVPLIKQISTSFDIGQHSTTYRFNDNKDVFVAYTFFRFIEEIGIPLGLSHSKMDSKTVKGGLERIIAHSPSWARALMLRFGEEKLMDTVLGRDVVNNFTVTNSDNLVDSFLSRFYEFLPVRKNNSLAKAIIEITPEYLSRLSVKTSDEIKIKIYKFLQYIYQERIVLPNTSKLLERLIKSSSWNLQYKMVPVLFDTPLMDEQNANVQLYFEEPSYHLFLQNYEPKEQITIKESLISQMLEALRETNTIRIRAVSRLFLLYKLRLLNDVQSDRYFELLWSRVNPQSGFPEGTRFYNYAYLAFPHPDNINPETLFKRFVIEGAFNVQAFSSQEGVSMTHGRDLFVHEIIGGSATIFTKEGITWNEIEILKIWEKCKQWWDLDKHYLKDDRYKSDGFIGSVFDEFKKRFSNLVKVISNVLGYQKGQINKKGILKEIVDLIKEVEVYGLPAMRAKAAFGEFFYSKEEDYLTELLEMMLSGNHDTIIDAINSAIIIAEYNDLYHDQKHFMKKLLKTLCQPIEWKVKGVMEHCVDAIINFIKYKSEIDLSDTIKIVLKFLEDFSVKSKLEQTNEYSIDEKLLYRKKAIKLASVLYNYFETNAKEFPQILINWQNVSLDNKEFSDVTNQWSEIN